MPTVSGKTLGEVIAAAEVVPQSEVVRSTRRPDLSAAAASRCCTAISRPAARVIKHSSATPALLKHTGRAVVFDSLDDLAARIDAPDLDVTPEDVLVLRNAGPQRRARHARGRLYSDTEEAGATGVKDMVRISDARMSGTAFGTIVLHITPEAAIGGPLALGANRRHDPARRRRNARIELCVAPEELSAPPCKLPLCRRSRIFRRQVIAAFISSMSRKPTAAATSTSCYPPPRIGSAPDRRLK